MAGTRKPLCSRHVHVYCLPSASMQIRDKLWPLTASPCTGAYQGEVAQQAWSVNSAAMAMAMAMAMSQMQCHRPVVLPVRSFATVMPMLGSEVVLSSGNGCQSSLFQGNGSTPLPSNAEKALKLYRYYLGVPKERIPKVSLGALCWQATFCQGSRGLSWACKVCWQAGLWCLLVQCSNNLCIDAFTPI